jgi:hypothetical protein
VVVGWTDPEGTRPYLDALLLGYYDSGGRLIYAGRAGTGSKQAELQRLWRRLQPLAVSEMPLEVPPPRSSRFRGACSRRASVRLFASPRSVFSNIPHPLAGSPAGATTTCSYARKTQRGSARTRRDAPFGANTARQLIE